MCIRDRRDPFHRSLSSLIHLADQLAWRAEIPSTVGTTPCRLDEDAYEQTGLTAEVVEDLLPLVQEDFGASEMPW